MRRYRVTNFELDARATILTLEIGADWAPEVKTQFENSKQAVREGFLHEYGVSRSVEKLRNVVDLGAAPLSIIAYHNRFLAQVRASFVACAYYPALTGSCALGERLLNHLVIDLRGFFRSSPEYRKVYRKSSFDNWDLAISALEAWKILVREVPTLFRTLSELRNRSVHFTPGLEAEDRAQALSAIRTLSEIIQRQFGSFGTHPWFIPDIPGAAFISKAWEDKPFIRTVYIPNCVPVSPFHKMEHTPAGWRVIEPREVPDRDVSDDEFRELLATAHGRGHDGDGA